MNLRLGIPHPPSPGKSFISPNPAKEQSGNRSIYPQIAHEP